MSRMVLTTEYVCCEVILVTLRSGRSIFSGSCGGIVEAVFDIISISSPVLAFTRYHGKESFRLTEHQDVHSVPPERGIPGRLF